MASIRLGPGVLEDLRRIATHLRHHGIGNADARADEIISALDVLAGNPLIGRPAGEDRHELVIGRGSHGHVALYRHVVVADTVFVLAVRAQRKGGYARDE